MPLSSYLTKPLRWLRAGYPAQAPPHAYVPLIALMPSPAAQVEDLLHTGELPPRFTTPPQAGDAAAATNLTKTATPSQAQIQRPLLPAGSRCLWFTPADARVVTIE